MSRSERYIPPYDEEERLRQAQEAAEQFDRDRPESLRSELKRIEKADLVELTRRISSLALLLLGVAAHTSGMEPAIPASTGQPQTLTADTQIWIPDLSGGNKPPVRGDDGSSEPGRRTDAETFVGAEQVFVIYRYYPPSGQVEVRRTATGLADRSDMDHIIEAIRRIHAHSAALAKVA